MSILWKPNGTLDVATEPTDLPQSGDAKNQVSEALARCKNLRLDSRGRLSLRDGSTKLNASAIATAIWLVIVQGGTRYAFAGTAIYEDESSIATGLTSAQWSGMLYNQFNDTTQQVYALNGTDRKRIEGSTVYEWGIEPPSAAPTLGAASTGLTGDYLARITYCKKVGSVVVSESNPSPAPSAAQTLSNQGLTVTWAASSDPQVTHVRVYRTLADGAIYFHDQDVAIGTTTVTTTTTDANLGTQLATDHDRPPLGSFVLGPTYDGTAFIIKDNLLYYCKPKQPEYWPTTYFIEVSPVQFPGKSLVFHNGQPYFLTTEEIYYIQGTGNGTFFPLPMRAKTGAQGHFGAVSVAGHGIFHTGPDGVYLFSGTDKKITQAQFDPIFRGETKGGVPGVASMSTAVLHYYNGKLYFGYAASGESFPANWLVTDLETQRTTYFVYNDGSDVQIRCLATDQTNDRLIAGDNTGFVRTIENQSVTDDSGTAISWEARSKEFTLQTRAHFPRWNKYDIDASSAASCVANTYLDGSSIQSHTITGDRDTKRRLIVQDNGERCQFGISGSGPITIYAVEGQ